MTQQNLLRQYGLNEHYEKLAFDKKYISLGLIPARIIAQHKDLYSVITDNGEKNAKVSGSFLGNDKDAFPVVGDFVMLKETEYGISIIHEVLQRTSILARESAWLRTAERQAIAANFDVVFIVTSLNQDLNIRRLERYLSFAWQSGAIPVVVLTKLDICENRELITEVEAQLIGTDIIALSAVTGENTDLLKIKLESGKTFIFLGMSGVGKSTLVNMLFGQEIMKVSEIREDDSRGRHTTTHKEMFLLPNGSLVIDTPGMRSLDIGNSNDGVSAVFDDIEELMSQCRYADCTHTKEPFCAVRAAIRNGTLEADRYQSYLKLKRVERFEMKKEQIVAKRLEKSRSKAPSRQQKHIKAYDVD